VGALVAVALVPMAPSGVPILAAVVGIVPGVVVARRRARDGRAP
jgi:hypothetical protein